MGDKLSVKGPHGLYVEGERVLYKEIDRPGVLLYDENKKVFAITFGPMQELTISGIQNRQANSKVIRVIGDNYKDIHSRLLKFAQEFAEDKGTIENMKQRAGDLFRYCRFIRNGVADVNEVIYLGTVCVDSDIFSYTNSYMGHKHLYLVYASYKIDTYTDEILGQTHHADIEVMLEKGIFIWGSLGLARYGGRVYNKTNVTKKLDKYLGHVDVFYSNSGLGLDGYYRMENTSYRIKPLERSGNK